MKREIAAALVAANELAELATPLAYESYSHARRGLYAPLNGASSDLRHCIGQLQEALRLMKTWGEEEPEETESGEVLDA